MVQSSSSSLSAPLLPQLISRPVWAGYNQAEKAHAAHLQKAEVRVLPVIVAAYLWLAWRIAPDGVELIPVASLYVSLLEWFCTVLAIHVVYVCVRCFVYPTEDSPDLFGVTSGPVGRYIYLTRITLSLQAVHLLVSAAAPFLSARLAAGAYAMTVPVGGLAIFVTTQFFILARPTPEHREDCRLWASRGVYYSFQADYIHIPAGAIAIVEVVVVKQRELLLSSMPALANILIGYFAFVAFYVGLIHGNFRLTGYWPYGFLKDLGLDPVKWTKFVFTQFVILSIFMMISWALPQVTPAVW